MTTETGATRAETTSVTDDSSAEALAAADGTPFGNRPIPDREYAVVLAAFDDEEGASNARDCLSNVASRGADIKDIVQVRTDDCGVVHVQRLPGGSTRRGLAAGMLGGAAVGVLLAPPLGVSMLAFGLAGAAIGRMRHERRKAVTGAALLGALEPNTSAVLAVVKADDLPKAAAVLPTNGAVRTTYVDGRSAGNLTRVARRAG